MSAEGQENSRQMSHPSVDRLLIARPDVEAETQAIRNASGHIENLEMILDDMLDGESKYRVISYLMSRYPNFSWRETPIKQPGTVYRGQ